MTPSIPSSPGIYYNLPDAVYRAIPAVSQSTLKDFMVCPQKWKLAPKKEVTPAMRYGSLVDSMWLTRDLSRYAVQPPTYETEGMRCPICGSITDSQKCAKCKVERQRVTVQNQWSGNSTTCREWVAAREAAGMEVITHDQFTMAKNACARLDAVEEIKKQRERCDVQVAVVSELCGVMCKGLIDMVPKKEFRKALGDLKTAQSADPKDWPRQVYDRGHAFQAALYLDLWNKESGESLEWFYHFVSEQAPPHEPCFMPLSQAFINLGRIQYQRALRLWAECQEKQEFPGYPMNVVTEVENWMLKQADQ